MNRKLSLVAALLLAGGWLLGGPVSNRVFPLARTEARQPDALGTAARWEYCSLTRAAYAGQARSGGYWIVYFRDTGIKTVDVEASATEGSEAALGKAIARLGAEGWEMVAPGPLDVRQGAANALYFKRPVQ